MNSAYVRLFGFCIKIARQSFKAKRRIRRRVGIAPQLAIQISGSLVRLLGRAQETKYCCYIVRVHSNAHADPSNLERSTHDLSAGKLRPLCGRVEGCSPGGCASRWHFRNMEYARCRFRSRKDDSMPVLSMALVIDSRPILAL